MFCAQCGGTLRDTAKFCAVCGAAVPREPSGLAANAVLPPSPQTSPSGARTSDASRTQRSRPYLVTGALVILAAVIVGAWMWTQRTPPEGPLFPVFSGGKLAYIDLAGHLAVKTTFDQGGLFEGRLVSVYARQAASDRVLWGFIDRSGAPVVPATFEGVGAFEDGLADVSQNGKCGYIDERGQFAIPQQFDGCQPFHEGVAAVLDRSKRKWGYIDKTGRLIIPYQYISAQSFKTGLATAAVEDSQATSGTRIGDSMFLRYGYIDHSGQWILEPKYSNVQDFSENLAAVELQVPGGVDEWMFIDKVGAVVVRGPFNGPSSFKQGFACVLAPGGKQFFINVAGRMQFPGVQCESLNSEFSDGLAPVRFGRQWGFIDKSGSTSIQPIFDRVGNFRNGLAVAVAGRDHGWINTKGEFVWKSQDSPPQNWWW